jgi:hypothetical protein
MRNLFSILTMAITNTKVVTKWTIWKCRLENKTVLILFIRIIRDISYSCCKCVFSYNISFYKSCILHWLLQSIRGWRSWLKFLIQLDLCYLGCFLYWYIFVILNILKLLVFIILNWSLLEWRIKKIINFLIIIGCRSISFRILLIKLLLLLH